MTNFSSSTDRLARQLVADVAIQARQKPNRWVMLGDIVPKLGVFMAGGRGSRPIRRRQAPRVDRAQHP